MPTPAPTVPQSSPKNIVKKVSTTHFREVLERGPLTFTMPLRFPYRSDEMLNSICELSIGSVRSISDRKRRRECLIYVSTSAMSDAAKDMIYLNRQSIKPAAQSLHKRHDDNQASEAGESKVRPPGGACNT